MAFSSNPKKPSKVFKNKNEAVTLEEMAALVADFQSLKEEFSEARKELREDLKSQNTWIIGGFIVLVAGAVGIIITVTLGVLTYQNYLSDLSETKTQGVLDQHNINSINNRIDQLMIRNPYLK